MLSWGFFVAQWLGYGCSHVDGHSQRRFPLAFQVLPALIMRGGIWFLQESSHWLVEKERYEEARQVLSKLHGDGNNQDILELEFQEIRDTVGNPAVYLSFFDSGVLRGQKSPFASISASQNE